LINYRGRLILFLHDDILERGVADVSELMKGRYYQEPCVDDMDLQIEPQHALSPNEIDAIEDRLYEHNSV
jgi:hypothetical protein